MSMWSVKGKTVMITGATGGIGLAAARALAGCGARLVLVGRDRSRGSTAVGLIKSDSPGAAVQFLEADFSSLDSVSGLIKGFLRMDSPLHVLINNAGIMNTRRRVSQDCVEEMFAVNYLAHYLLTRALLPRMQDSTPARIIHVASHAHAYCKGINFLDLNHARSYSSLRVYGHSKLANIQFSNELARRLEGSGVSSNSLHPGVVATGLGRNSGLLGKLVPALIRPFARSPERGAQTVLHLATSTEVDGVSGKYFRDSLLCQPKPWALDAAAATRLWDVSDRLIKGYL